MTTVCDDDIFDETATDIDIGSKELKKRELELSKDGYRSGLTDGQEAELQTGFNEGFCLAATHLKRLSKLRGELCALLYINHLYSEDQKQMPQNVQSQMESLLQDIQTYEHTCIKRTNPDMRKQGDNYQEEMTEELNQKITEFHQRLQLLKNQTSEKISTG